MDRANDRRIDHWFSGRLHHPEKSCGKVRAKEIREPVEPVEPVEPEEASLPAPMTANTYEEAKRLTIRGKRFPSI